MTFLRRVLYSNYSAAYCKWMMNFNYIKQYHGWCRKVLSPQLAPFGRYATSMKPFDGWICQDTFHGQFLSSFLDSPIMKGKLPAWLVLILLTFSLCPIYLLHVKWVFGFRLYAHRTFSFLLDAFAPGRKNHPKTRALSCVLKIRPYVWRRRSLLTRTSAPSAGQAAFTARFPLYKWRSSEHIPYKCPLFASIWE